MIEVQSNIAIPKKANGRPAHYPWDKMKVGDSFFVATSHESKTLSGAAASASRRHSMKFSVRKVEGGVRCWRIA